jgi:hypothetical protein
VSAPNLKASRNWYLRVIITKGTNGAVVLVKTTRPITNHGRADIPIPNPAAMLRTMRDFQYPLGIMFEGGAQ